MLSGVLLLAVRPARALEPRTWDYAGGGQWPLVQAPASQAVDNPILDRAEKRLREDPGGAESLILDWVNSHRTAPDRDRGLLLLADSYYRQGNRIKAFYQLDELVETYPESRYFFPALEQQYRIADDFLRGAKRKFLGLYILSATDEAIDMLFRIQERSPGSPLAEKSMLRTADYYYNTAQFDFAADVYAAYARSYPRSPQIPRVRLRRAFSSYAQFNGVRFDTTPLIEARTQFEDIKVRYPELAAEENVQRFIDAINATLARKLLYTADFYRRTDHPTAAAYTYRQLMQSYPSSGEARSAEQALRQLPAFATAAPVPATTRPFEVPATTRPTRGPTQRIAPAAERTPAGEPIVP